MSSENLQEFSYTSGTFPVLVMEQEVMRMPKVESLVKIDGKRLAALRIKEGFTQEELAPLVPVSKNQLSNWESSVEPPEIGIKRFRGLASVFKITLDQLRDEIGVCDPMRELSRCVELLRQRAGEAGLSLLEFISSIEAGKLEPLPPPGYTQPVINEDAVADSEPQKTPGKSRSSSSRKARARKR